MFFLLPVNIINVNVIVLSYKNHQCCCANVIILIVNICHQQCVICTKNPVTQASSMNRYGTLVDWAKRRSAFVLIEHGESDKLLSSKMQNEWFFIDNDDDVDNFCLLWLVWACRSSQCNRVGRSQSLKKSKIIGKKEYQKQGGWKSIGKKWWAGCKSTKKRFTLRFGG